MSAGNAAVGRVVGWLVVLGAVLLGCGRNAVPLMQGEKELLALFKAKRGRIRSEAAAKVGLIAWQRGFRRADVLRLLGPPKSTHKGSTGRRPGEPLFIGSVFETWYYDVEGLGQYLALEFDERLQVVTAVLSGLVVEPPVTRAEIPFPLTEEEMDALETFRETYGTVADEIAMKAGRTVVAYGMNVMAVRRLLGPPTLIESGSDVSPPPSEGGVSCSYFYCRESAEKCLVIEYDEELTASRALLDGRPLAEDSAKEQNSN